MTVGKNIYDFVQCVPATFDRTIRATNGIIAPVAYEVTGAAGTRDQPFIGEVLSTGPGIEPETMCVAHGDVFICTVHNISYRVTELGRKTYMVRNGVVYATIDKETFVAKPVQDLILVKTGRAESCKSTQLETWTVEDRALIHMREAGGKFWLPTEAMSTDDVRSPAIVAEYGEVVACGPGRWRDGKWSEPPCKAGDLILFDASYSTLPVRIRGESFTLVPAPQLVKIADES